MPTRRRLLSATSARSRRAKTQFTRSGSYAAPTIVALHRPRPRLLARPRLRPRTGLIVTGLNQSVTGSVARTWRPYSKVSVKTRGCIGISRTTRVLPLLQMRQAAPASAGRGRPTLRRVSSVAISSARSTTGKTRTANAPSTRAITAPPWWTWRATVSL